jgi:hypothetical protein
MIQHTLLKKLIVLLATATMAILILLLSNGQQVVADPIQEARAEPTAQITPELTEVATAEPTGQATPESTEGPAIEEEPAEVATAEPTGQATPKSTEGAAIEEEPAEAATAELSQYAPVAPLSQIVLAGNPVTGTTNTGQTLSISIDTPPDDEKVLVPPGQLDTVIGRAVIGNLSATTNILYVVDVSGSTSGPSGQDCDGNGVAGDAGDNLNGNSTVGDTLDCEISGVMALNESLFNYDVEVGLIPFGSGAAIADVDPAAGQQDFTSPTSVDKNANNTPDLEEVARSLDQGEVNLFTYKLVGGTTDFNNALISMNSAFSSQPPGERNTAFFLADANLADFDSGLGSPLEEATKAGTIVNTFAVGPGASGGCNVGEDLYVIADTTGGTCTEVMDPSQLQAVLEGMTPADIDRVELRLNNGHPMGVTMDALGNWSLATPPLTGINVGPNVISATVYATDATTMTAATALTADITVWGVDIIARDDTHTMEQDSPPITIEVLTNDATSAGSLTITTFTQPASGVATLTNTASGPAFIYAPNPGFSGDDTFTYTISNGLGFDTATVRVTVIPRPPAPTPTPPPSPERDGGGTTIPEPTTITLVGLGLGGLAAYARRRRRQANGKQSPGT